MAKGVRFWASVRKIERHEMLNLLLEKTHLVYGFLVSYNCFYGKSHALCLNHGFDGKLRYINMKRVRLVKDDIEKLNK